MQTMTVGGGLDSGRNQTIQNSRPATGLQLELILDKEIP
jgi:hypothetical protein